MSLSVALQVNRARTDLARAVAEELELQLGLLRDNPGAVRGLKAAGRRMLAELPEECRIMFPQHRTMFADVAPQEQPTVALAQDADVLAVLELSRRGSKSRSGAPVLFLGV